MGAPAKKVDESQGAGPGAREGRPAPLATDADLEVFRAMKRVSRRATAKELDRLIRPES